MAFSTPITKASHAQFDISTPPPRPGLCAVPLDSGTRQHPPGSQALQQRASAGDVSPGQLNQQQQQYQHWQRTQQSSVSPVQNPRVSGLIGSSASSPSQAHNNLVGQPRRYVSAPNSSTNTHLNNSPRTRPPVPLFSQSTGNVQKMTETPFEHSEDIANMECSFSDLTGLPEGHLQFVDEPLQYSHVDSFESLNDLSASTHSASQTVSPKDVMVDTMSAPPSATMTNLTTPGTSTYDSPFLTYSTDTSPMFKDLELDGADNWPSLFPEEEPLQSVAMGQSLSSSSSSGAAYNTSPAIANASPASHMSRTYSSPGQKTSKSGRQHSFTSGVGARKRDKPLPAITVEDPNDSIAVKRARNTMAARKSRQKRMEEKETLVHKVEELERELEESLSRKEFYEELCRRNGLVE